MSNGIFYNSEAIFETIGNYPVVDQFDILYSKLQSGSYMDNYVTGSMLLASASAAGFGFTFVPAGRGLAFSKLGVIPGSLPCRETEAKRNSYELQPFREKAGILRNQRIFSGEERFYDSLVPNVADMFEMLGGSAIFNDASTVFAEGQGQILITLSGNDKIFNPSSVFGFIESFPFEPIFSEIRRIRKIPTVFNAKKDQSGNRIAPRRSSGIVIRDMSRLVTRGTVGDEARAETGIYWVGRQKFESNALDVLSSNDVAKILFGFGDGRTQSPPNFLYSAVSYTQINPYAPMWRSLQETTVAAVGSIYKAIGPIIRGWKYGLHDGNPHYTSCVYRRDRYGQFRDMLEQRLYPAIILDRLNSPINSPLDEARAMPIQKTDSAVGLEFPVQVAFVKQLVTKQGTTQNQIEVLTYPSTTPNLTWSSNLSTYATSSMPYFDVDNNEPGKNRGPLPISVTNPTFAYTTDEI
jgi:hypothetical protein